jgi:hypothetical protein
LSRGVIVPTERISKVGEMALAKIEIKVPPPGLDWRKQPVTTAPMTLKTTASGTTRPSGKVIAAKKRQLAGKKRMLAQHKAQAEAKLVRQKRMEKQQEQK